MDKAFDFSGIRTFSARDRVNLVRIDNLKTPGEDAVPAWGGEDFDELCQRILAARRRGRPVIWSMGAHVIKCGLSRYLIDLMRRGVVTHVAGNGACSIHDFELCYLGGTSEDVPTAIEDGSFGMWEETGLWMNEAIRLGARNGWGYGESLARYIDAHKQRFPHTDDCVLYQAYTLGVPATYHIALGTDIIHQHPSVDFAAIGATSGVDFHRICESVSRLDGGVYLNFGSGVIGPEVFLKALSISRNLGYPTFDITTANFDLIDLGDYRRKIGYDDPQYYYRPRKNIVNRPVSRGGKGWHFQGDHQETIPNLHRKIAEAGFTRADVPFPGGVERIVRPPEGGFRHAIFDFDGTVSLIREGWQGVMTPYFVEELAACPEAEGVDELTRAAREFIDLLTGKQTIYQCIRLAEEVEKRGGAPKPPAEYKAEYLRRLALHTKARLSALEGGAEPEEYVVKGAREFLEALRARGVACYLASGTDEADVRREAGLLGVDGWFDGIYGANDEKSLVCSKEVVIERLLRERGVKPETLLCFGDGYVEIELTARAGGYAVGVATNEREGGVDEGKRRRLIGAGAGAICADFARADELMALLFGAEASR